MYIRPNPFQPNSADGAAVSSIARNASRLSCGVFWRSPCRLRDAIADDARAIAAIYNPYILNTTISFEEEAVTDAAMAQRIADVQGGGLPWLVAERDGKVLGYAYATKWRVRHAYRFSVESSVYLAPEAARQGVGTALYTALLAQLAERGVHLVIGGIALPNDASVALHEKMGYEKVAHFREVGFKFGRWLDVGYWQKKLA
jgi:phosphinothricin acetyltransferase